ncbi:NAD(P)H-dependent oxidoreductase [Pseudomonas sp. TH08]|nr:NAD(P)H-dependent oxidoreductase [Pseudomonas sp. TH08]
MGKRILLILGHPSASSFCAALAEGYAQSALEAGHEVRQLRLGALDFDPVLCAGYQQVQALEDDLSGAQSDILWAEHLTLVYPIWWGGIPALLKGFFDRVLLKLRNAPAPPSKVSVTTRRSACCPNLAAMATTASTINKVSNC